MNRMNSRFLVGAAIAAFAAIVPTPGTSQTTFQACRVPAVGAIYMINVAGAPAACLDASHVAFSWTEGGTLADGSVTSAKIADGTIAAADLGAGAVTTAAILDGTIGVADIATDGVGAAEIVADAVGTSEIIANGVGTAEIADGAVTLAKLNAGVPLGFSSVVMRLSSAIGTPLPAGQSTFISVDCLPGEVAVGGAGVNQNRIGVHLKQFYPTPLSDGATPTGWNLSYENTTGVAATGYLYVLCAS
jgi:hypothetical protein